MAKMIANEIRRSGSSSTKTFHLVVFSDKNPKGKALATAIKKVEMEPEFRFFGKGKRVPIEQYAFQVGSKVYQRFADAVAVVLKRHNVGAPEDMSEAQLYVQKAFRIVSGAEPFAEVPTDKVVNYTFNPGDDEPTPEIPAHLDVEGDEELPEPAGQA